MRRCLICLLFALELPFLAQIDTLKFETKSGLFVFSGKLNEVNVNFAFDTGAALSVVHSDDVVETGVKIKRKKVKVNDSNSNVNKMSYLKPKSIQIGSFKFTKFKAITFDMNFLKCNDLLLLGNDVIKQLNWKINFDKKELYISKTAFSFDTSYSPITYTSGGIRPYVNFKINGILDQNCLIDFGYSGEIELNSSLKQNSSILKKDDLKKVSRYINSSFGLSGMSKPDTVTTVLIETIAFSELNANRFPVEFVEGKENKIGWKFFSQNSSITILNHSEKIFLVKQKLRAPDKLNGFEVKATVINQKLIIIGKNLDTTSTARFFEIGEEIKSINGKTAVELIDDCGYLKFTYDFIEDQQIAYEKMDGTKVLINRK